MVGRKLTALDLWAAILLAPVCLLLFICVFGSRGIEKLDKTVLWKGKK
jgi:purine-cytosine permease-like protein